ncbi:MAG: threonine synthase [Bacteroidota bacterium]
MKYYSTSGSLQPYTLSEAVLNGLPDDSGLFMPEKIPVLPPEFFSNLHNLSFSETAFEIAYSFLKEDVSEEVIHTIIKNAVNFPAPVVTLDEQTKILELFHGPTLAFKDFGARFMGQLMAHLVRNHNQRLTILVATSGDTGGAVANGFYRTEGIEVIILYPSGKVSPLQEKQLTTLGENITALEIQGTFDDCQKLVKTAFHDIDLLAKYHLSSANSINISRLIPQSFYYVEAYKQVQDKNLPVVFSIPSGNFGNLTAGILAKKMGLPVSRFIASVNANDVFTNYLNSGEYLPRTSVQTLSNAMDVGAPSNFARLLSIYINNITEMRKDIISYSFNDEETTMAMKEVYSKFKYIMDPHGAVAYLGWKKYQETNKECLGIILETAHPSKFIETVEEVLQIELQIPVELSSLSEKKKSATLLPTEYNSFKEFLLNR